MANAIRETAEKVLGMTTGKKLEDKETLVVERPSARSREEEERSMEGKTYIQRFEKQMQIPGSQKKAEVAVAHAKREANGNVYGELEAVEAITMVCRIANQREQATKDVHQIRIVKDAAGSVQTNEEEVLKRWKDYFKALMNVENPIERHEEEPPLINFSVHVVTRDEFKTALQKLEKVKH